MSIQLSTPTPYAPQADTDGRKLPAKFTNHRFVYVHYASGWSWVPGLGFLPDLSTIVAKPGVNGVDITGRLNKPSAGALQKGGMVINPVDPRLGPWRGYLGSFDTVNGKHWCFIRAGFTILPGGNVKERDCSADYHAFLQHLMTANMVHPMDQVVYNERIEIEDRKIERLARAAAENPHKKGRYEAAMKTREEMVAWWAKYTVGTDAIPAEGISLPAAAPAPAIDADDIPLSKPRGRRQVEVSS
jgi:hypothetical protein